VRRIAPESISGTIREVKHRQFRLKEPLLLGTTSASVDRVLAVAHDLVDACGALATRIAEVPAPTGDEAKRATFVRQLLVDHGYEDVREDSIHNVTARIPGEHRDATPLLLAAHVDTVFPRSTPLHIVREGNRIHGPGIGDNSLSVAVVLLLRTALERLGLTPAVDVIVTGNVGEEGLGDLRGMRAVMDAHPEIGAAIAIEGQTLGRLTHQAVGSKRYEVTVTGPGGHSWGDAGRPSAIHALSNLIARLDRLPLKHEPKTTLNVGMITGGISVNTIAPTASAIIDLRSVDVASLDFLAAQVEAEVRLTASRDVSVAIRKVGDRPAGSVPLDKGIVPIGVSVLRALGLDATCDASSTDANIPISRGIPAMGIGLATGGNVHRPDEYIDLDRLGTGFAQLIMLTMKVTQALSKGKLA
jgi:acetylornithine deacetylase/succinyl-diaminopimelate desuccinylase-like protein